MNVAVQPRMFAGFADPSIDSQRVFRTLLKAMSRPGHRQDCPAGCSAPEPLAPVTAAAALCLFDHEIPFWLDDGFCNPAVIDFFRFHLGVRPCREPSEAAFALIWNPMDMPTLDRFRQGSAVAPEHSATLILQVPSLEAGEPIELVGPGIESSVTIRPAGLPKWFWKAWAENHESFPLGVDLIFSHDCQLVALPRTAAER